MQEEVTRGAVTLIVDGAKLSEQVFEKAVKKFLEEIPKVNGSSLRTPMNLSGQKPLPRL